MLGIEESLKEKNAMLEKSAETIEYLKKELDTANEKIAEQGEEIVKLGEELNGTIVKLSSTAKREQAIKLANSLVSKGNLDPINFDDAVERFVNSPDSIEKLSSIANLLTNKSDEPVGSIHNPKKKSAETEAEERFNRRRENEKINK